MNPILPNWTVPLASVGAVMSVRAGGVSVGSYGDMSGRDGMNLGLHVGDRAEDVQRNRMLLQTLQQEPLPAEPAWLTQVHGNLVIDAAQATNAPQADASFTTQRGVVCAIMTADCLPVLFADASGRAVGAAHAGWRGLAGGVLENTVMRMREAGADNLHAWLGPAIGPARFEVGEDVLQAFVQKDAGMRQAFHAIDGNPGKYLADIYQLARLALAQVGVTRVTGGDCCTMSDAERFYSYRRDGVTGRMAALIWLR